MTRRQTIVVTAKSFLLCAIACAAGNSVSAHYGSSSGGWRSTPMATGGYANSGFRSSYPAPTMHFEPHAYEYAAPAMRSQPHLYEYEAPNPQPQFYSLSPKIGSDVHMIPNDPGLDSLRQPPASKLPIQPPTSSHPQTWRLPVTEMAGSTTAAHLSFRPSDTQRAQARMKLFSDDGLNRSVPGWGPAVSSDWFAFSQPRTILPGSPWHIGPLVPHDPVPTPIIMHTHPHVPPPALYTVPPRLSSPPVPPSVTPITIAIPSQAIFSIHPQPANYLFSAWNSWLAPNGFLFYPQQLSPFNLNYDSSNIFFGSVIEPRQSPLSGANLLPGSDSNTTTSLGGGMMMGYLNRSDTGPPIDIRSPYSLEEEMVFIPDQYGGYWISRSYIATALAEKAGVPSDLVYIPDAYGGYFLSRSYLATALCASGRTSQMPADLVYVPDSYGGYFISRSYLATALARNAGSPASN